MSRRANRLCSCGRRPVRRIRGARLCSPCAARAGKHVCETCGETKFADLFATKTRCLTCQRDALHEKRVAETYSLEPGRYAELLARQGGGCFICRRKPQSKRLAVDHDHSCCPGPVSCGKCVRGLLCRSCNRDVLGHLKDDITALERAIEYLTDPPAQRV